MDKLKWPSLPNFKAAKRTPVYPDTDPTKMHTGAFYQAYKNLGFYWILEAGHMVKHMCATAGVVNGVRIISESCAFTHRYTLV